MHSIGTVAALTGVKVETIRYYERAGIVPLPARTASGRRSYDREDIARLRFVLRCRRLGFPVSDVRSLLETAQTSEMPCHETRATGRRHLATVRRKIEHLEAMERALTTMLEECDGEGPVCPMLDRMFDEPDLLPPVEG